MNGAAGRFARGLESHCGLAAGLTRRARGASSDASCTASARARVSSCRGVSGAPRLLDGAATETITTRARARRIQILGESSGNFEPETESAAAAAHEARAPPPELAAGGTRAPRQKPTTDAYGLLRLTPPPAAGDDDDEEAADVWERAAAAVAPPEPAAGAIVAAASSAPDTVWELAANVGFAGTSEAPPAAAAVPAEEQQRWAQLRELDDDGDGDGDGSELHIAADVPPPAAPESPPPAPAPPLAPPPPAAPAPAAPAAAPASSSSSAAAAAAAAAATAKAEKLAEELQEVKKLKVAELKDALQARGLDDDGKKDKLVARLEAAIKKEAADASAAAAAATAAAKAAAPPPTRYPTAPPVPKAAPAPAATSAAAPDRRRRRPRPSVRAAHSRPVGSVDRVGRRRRRRGGDGGGGGGGGRRGGRDGGDGGGGSHETRNWRLASSDAWLGDVVWDDERPPWGGGPPPDVPVIVDLNDRSVVFDTDLRAPADDDDETEATASVANDPAARARASRALAARMVRGLDLSLDAEYSRRRSERQKAKLSSPRLPQLPPANRLECGRAAFEMTPDALARSRRPPLQSLTEGQEYRITIGARARRRSTSRPSRCYWTRSR